MARILFTGGVNFKNITEIRRISSSRSQIVTLIYLFFKKISYPNLYYEAMKNSLGLVNEAIVNKIYFIRGKKVMIDKDLAVLYEVPTKVLNQAVKRNSKRFPVDFMFMLSSKEIEESSRSQFVTLNRGKNIKYPPTAFTEQGIAMLSSVLKSERAIQVNIQIMRIFTKMREMLASNTRLQKKLEEMEEKYDSNFKIVFDTLRKLLAEEAKPKTLLGFRTK